MALGQRAGGLAAAVGAHAGEVEGVVPDLGGVVEDAAGRGVPDDFLEGHVLELGAGNQVVQVVHVGGVMLVVVEVQRLGRDVGLERVLGVRKFRQFVCHGRFSLSWKGARARRDETLA